MKKQVVPPTLDEPSDAGISNYMRTRRAYLGAEAEVVEEAPPSPPRFKPGGRVDEARALVADVLKTPAEPYAPPPKAKSPAKPKRKARKAPAAAQARPLGPAAGARRELKGIVVTRASESQYADRFYRFLVDCSTRGDWRKAVQAYRLMVAKGLVPDARTWRVLLRAVKIGEEGGTLPSCCSRLCGNQISGAPRHRVVSERRDSTQARGRSRPQAAQRAGTDGLVPVELYNCALEAAAAGGGWRRAVQVFNRMRHMRVRPNTSSRSSWRPSPKRGARRRHATASSTRACRTSRLHGGGGLRDDGVGAGPARRLSRRRRGRRNTRG